MRVRSIPLTAALVPLTVVPLALVACTAKTTTESATGDIVVTASDSSCEVSTDTAATGNTTFRITNNGNKTTEFYVYGDGDRVMGEVENIGPGVSRSLIVALPEAATYTTACKPGMVGSGIRADFVVTGESVTRDDTGKLADASAGYKRYLVSQVTALQESTGVFVDAVLAGNIDAAKTQFPVARTYYERIEPVAEAFPDNLDPRIDQREADLEPGAAWTGFHRLEKDLWVSGLAPDTAAIADRLRADIGELVAGVSAADFTVDPVTVAGGAQGLLDEIATSKITGEEDIFSHTDLWDFAANVDGSQAAVAALQPIIVERNPELDTTITTRFADIDAELDKHRTGDGYVFYDTVDGPARQALSQKIDALSAAVSQVQGVVAGV